VEKVIVPLRDIMDGRRRNVIRFLGSLVKCFDSGWDMWDGRSARTGWEGREGRIVRTRLGKNSRYSDSIWTANVTKCTLQGF